MSVLLQKLSKESILLMYLAGELPEEDRVELEQMLAGDAALRAELEQLRSAYESVDAAMQQADASERVGLPAGTAARRVGNAVRSWHAKRLSQPAPEVERRRLRFPVWSYPLGAAAVLLIMYAGWWGIQSEPPSSRTQTRPANNMPLQVADDDRPEDLLPSDPSWPAAPSDDVSYADAGDFGGDAALDAVEDDLYALSQSSAASTFIDDDSSLLFIGETDER